MKLFKYVTLFITLFFFMLLVGCNMFEGELINTDDDQGLIDNDDEELRPNDNDDKKNIEKNYEGPLSFQVKFKRVGSIINSSPIRVDDYKEYLRILKDNSYLDDYDEDFFKTSSLIIFLNLDDYNISDVSKSDVSVNSVILDSDNNIFVNIIRNTSLYGSCLRSMYAFVIEYEKPNDSINEITLKLENRGYSEDYFNYIEYEKDQINNLINNKLIEKIRLNILIQCDIDFDKMQNDEEFYEIVKDYIEKYSLDRLVDVETLIDASFMGEGKIYLHPIINSVDDFNLDLLIELNNIDDQLTFGICFTYYNIECIEYKI